MQKFQVERTDSLELIPSVRKPSGSVSLTNRPVLSFKRQTSTVKEQPSKEHLPDTNTSSLSPYSPMAGYPNSLVSWSPPLSKANTQFMRIDVRDPLLGGVGETLISDGDANNGPLNPTSNHFSLNNNHHLSSYVPPGYILLDHTNSSGNRHEHCDMKELIGTQNSSV